MIFDLHLFSAKPLKNKMRCGFSNNPKILGELVAFFPSIDSFSVVGQRRVQCYTVSLNLNIKMNKVIPFAFIRVTFTASHEILATAL